MSETERTVKSLLDLTNLRPRLKPINLAGTLCIEVSNPLASLSRDDRRKLVEQVQRNLLEVVG